MIEARFMRTFFLSTPQVMKGGRAAFLTPIALEEIFNNLADPLRIEAHVQFNEVVQLICTFVNKYVSILTPPLPLQYTQLINFTQFHKNSSLLGTCVFFFVNV